MSESRPQMRERLPALTSLRFFAAAYVVCFHVQAWTLPSFFAPVLQLGYTGVTFFFALSGFLLAHNYWNVDLSHAGSRADFFLSRAARLYPAYAAACCVEFLFARTFYTFSLSTDVLRFAVEAFLMQSWMPRISEILINLPLWSISNEAVFYYIFPKAIGGLKNIPRYTIYWGLAAWLLLVVSAYAIVLKSGHGLSLMDEGENIKHGTLSLSRFIKFFPLFHIGEFFTGILLYRFWIEHRRRIAERQTMLLAMCALASACLIALQWCIHDVWYVMGLSLLAWAPLILACASMDGGLLARPALIFLGEISYSMYLFHGLVLRVCIVKLPGYFSGTTSFLIGNSIVFFGTLVVAATVYVCIEKPARRSILERYRKPIAYV